jgi:L-alanine-DL-glutamate epimerase-like enolase superfamily enzyme
MTAIPVAPFTLASLSAIALRVPFGDVMAVPRSAPAAWREFEIVLVRAETTDGVVGWGEAFAYGCQRAVQAALTDMVFPQAVGRSVGDIAAFTTDLQFRLHIYGRYGITLFAISGLDIALWDIAAKRASVPLATLLGGARRPQVPAYASLVRYAEEPALAPVAERAVGEGFSHIKLHEIDPAAIAAGRRAVGAAPLMTDVNCAWSRSLAEELMPKMRKLGLFWVEEPVFPPEDFGHLAALRRFGVPLAAGENACTAVEFDRLLPAVDHPQPSVIKVGGVSEFVKVSALAAAAGRTLMPHSPYFGPGYWATLQLAACEPEGLFGYMYVKPAAWLDPSIPLPTGGAIVVPQAPGIGFTPDADVLRRFRVG